MEKEHSLFSKTGNMLSRASNSLKPGPWEISPEALMFEAWNMVGRAGNGLGPGPWGSCGFGS